ncbi:uncharacterized protein PV09_07571 [Verruconis gallopava]|uniref:Mitochondrial carrier protein n=1 Tax=Verruconis gallopava TaxID=253628 RepID=A0A0D1YJN3_9PEZI|nr:uncharacterized protein PV09_07571 [Verruconis gallopava]KIW01057.1 hypothetical protein PV09_07571 [Verruconis gallopava]
MSTSVDASDSARPSLDLVESGQHDGRDGVRKPKSNAATGASAAGIRALSAQFVAFYFRAPMKAFFRARVDYMAYARAINPRIQAGSSWSWHVTTPGLLAHAVKEHGWSFIPNQVLPPMLANVTVGAVLYTSYLQSLAMLHEPSAYASRRVYPPPDPCHTVTAGAAAGAVQSLVAAPLDALQVRFKTSEMLEGHYKDMWHYAYQKLKSIGPQGVFAGYSLSLVKDAVGCALFFSTFEYVKAQIYYGFLTRWYGKMDAATVFGLQRSADRHEGKKPIIRPHYMIEPTFLLLAGVGASVAQQVVQHPITRVQDVHYQRLESIDYAAQLENRKRSMFRLYYHAYEKTYEQCRRQARREGGWRRWLYRDFLWTTIRQTPSTSAGLIVFEIVRRKYADSSDVVRIRKDGYDILLT